MPSALLTSSEVHLDGPLTGHSEGVGQALATVGAQMHRMDEGLMLTNTLLRTPSSRLTQLPSEAYLARQALAAEEGLAYGHLMARTEEGYQRLLDEASAGLIKILTEAHRRLFQFTIDRTTPHKTFTISDDGTTATMQLNAGYANFRASQPLTSANHKWAVKIIEDAGKSINIVIGLLPKLSDAQVAKMEGGGAWIGTSVLGGWGMNGGGAVIIDNNNGKLQCPGFPFAKGDIVVCDLNFAARTLTFSCGDRKAVGTVPSIKEGDDLYPAVFMQWTGVQVALVMY